MFFLTKMKEEAIHPLILLK